MKGLWRSLLAVVAACAAFPAVAAATPVNNTPPSVVGTPQVGSDVGCSKGSWGSSLGGRIVTTEYQWFHATDLVNPIFVGNGRMSRYRPTTTDLGMQRVC